MQPLGLRGLVAAGMTPMRPDGSVDVERIPTLVDHGEREGVAAFYVNGSTGEGPSLAGWERRSTAEAWVAAARGRLPVVVQVGHNSLVEARELAAHAEEIGADAVSAVLPSYFKPPTLEAAVDCLAEVAAGAPTLPLVYYHVPALSGVALDVPAFLELALQRIRTLAGLKYTEPKVFEFQACVERFGARIDCLFGADEMLLSGLAAGAHGAVGSTYNFAAPLYRRLIAAFERGDLEAARREQARSVEMVRVILRHNGNAGLKATMKLIGLDCGPSRLPQVTVGGTELEALRAELDAIGFFDWARG